MYKIGLSTCAKGDPEYLFEDYKKAGIEAMEISVGIELAEVLDYKRIAQYAEKYGVNLWSFHIPFGPFEKIDISSTDKALRKSTIKYISELIKRVSVSGIDKYVIHPSGEPMEESERAEKIKCAQESLSELSKIAGEYGGVIAVENLPRTCLGRDSDDILKLIEADPALRVCFDTNHLLKEDPIEFIHKVGSKIVTTHVSDYDFVDEKHWLPGEGKMDWQAIYKSLQEVGYNGVWLYELDFKAPVHMQRSRSLNCEDFARNAKEIFNNQPLTIVK